LAFEASSVIRSVRQALEAYLSPDKINLSLKDGL
jgi:hypothetical protein